MPVFGSGQQSGNGMQQHSIQGGAFQFSAVRPEELGAAEYTLVTIVTDTTGSVAGFEPTLRNAVVDAVEACGKSPRADNLLVRFVTFNTDIQEEHGFKTLRQINPQQDYAPFRCDGMTALYDAVKESISATNAYAKIVMDHDFDVNGIVFIITDGMDNRSRFGRPDVAQTIQRIKKDEFLESLLVILIGVNADECSHWLDEFHKEAGLSQYVDIREFDASKGAKLAEFISKSTSAQSQSLGTGGASEILTF
jgi:uncharacterized protein YegL